VDKLVEALRRIDEAEAESRRKVADVVARARALCSREFADRLEKYAREHDLLPRNSWPEEPDARSAFNSSDVPRSVFRVRMEVQRTAPERHSSMFLAIVLLRSWLPATCTLTGCGKTFLRGSDAQH
jgi:hypothetical protein